MGLSELGRFLMIVGTVIFLLGLFFAIGEQFPIGKMIGDFAFKRGGFVIPVMTCVLLSVIVTLAVNFYIK